LRRLAEAVGSAAAVTDVYEAALDCVRDALGTGRAAVLLFDGDGVMRFKAWRGVSDAYRAAVEGHTPWTPDTTAARPVVIPDAAASEELRSLRGSLELAGIGALAFVPLVSRGRVIGKLVLYYDGPHTFPESELDIASTIGHQIGVAIDRVSTGQEIAALYRGAEAALEEESALREQLTQLTSAAERLLTSFSREAIVEEILSLARQVLTADAYAVWWQTNGRWRIAASAGLGEDPDLRLREYSAPTPVEAAVVIDDVEQFAGAHEDRRMVYRREGIRALAAVPLRVRGDVAGTIVLYYRRLHRATDVEMRAAEALGHMAAAAITNAELYAEQQRLRSEAERAATRAALLAEASALLSSLDYEANLRRVAELAVPRLADWCAVDLLDADGVIRRIAVVHQEPESVRLAHDVQRRYPTRLDQPSGVGAVIRTGRPELQREITAEMLAAVPDAELRRLVQQLQLRSIMTAPLTARGRTFGAITLVSTRANHLYGDDDLAFTLELAGRAALAIDNARLFTQTQEANRLKDEFLATLSHELRTPLNVILGRARMLKAEIGAHPSTDTIERNAAALARLVDDLLDVSRITMGQIRLDADRLQLADVVEGVVQGIQPAAAAKDIAVSVSRGIDVPAVLGDATRLQQVVWNLLTNAIKFTPGGGRVDIDVTAAGEEVVLTVADTGEGIDGGFLPHVFDMFRQAEPSSRRRHSGMGLGLSIARRIVELHGGAIAAHSDGPGHGATFTVRLPARASARDAATA
jgi:signal transduction histidine kinase